MSLFNNDDEDGMKEKALEILSDKRFRELMASVTKSVTQRLMESPVRGVTPLLLCYQYPFCSDDDEPQLNIAVTGDYDGSEESLAKLGGDIADRFWGVSMMALVTHGKLMKENKKTGDMTEMQEVISITGMTIDNRMSLSYITVMRNEDDRILPFENKVYDHTELSNQSAPVLETVFSAYRDKLASIVIQQVLTEGLTAVGLLKPGSIELN